MSRTTASAAASQEEKTNKNSSPKAESKYNINMLKYPSDLGSTELKHSIEFQITVRGKSKFNKHNRLYAVNRNPDAGGFSDKDLAKISENSALIAGSVLGYAISNKIFKTFDKSGSLPKKLTKILSGTVGIGAGILAKETVKSHKLLKPDVGYRISDAISLYIDGPPTVSYSMNYANKELGTLAGILSGSVLDSQSTGDGVSEGAAAFATALAKLPSIFGSTNVQAVLGASSKTSLNPFKEVIFESVDFRSFAFKYRFMPRSKKESEDVKRIIDTFKFHAHPEMSEGKLFFIYPAEFNITYYFGDKENKYFHKFAPCVLSSIDISYGEGMFSSFNDGNPTEVLLSLTFREVEILTKQQIQEGY